MSNLDQDVPPDPPAVVIAEFADRGSADAIAALLRSEGVRVSIETAAVLAGIPSVYKLLVAERLAHRARWILQDSEFSESELAFLATGKLDGGEDSSMEATEPKRPILVTIYALFCGVAFVGVLTLLGWSAACSSLGCYVPRSPSGESPLDVAWGFGLLVPFNLVWLAVVSVGLWRGLRWVRHLIVATWVAAGLFAIGRALLHVAPLALADDALIFLVTSTLLWWYLFRSWGCVSFFTRPNRRAA